MTKSEQNRSNSDGSVWVTSDNVVGCDIKGEMVMLHLQSGTYFGLNPVGARIWTLLQEGKTVSEIHQHLLEQYKVSRAQCEAEVAALLTELHNRGLIIKASNEKAA